MAPLEVRINDELHDLNTLRRDIKFFVQESISYDFANGKVPDWLMAGPCKKSLAEKVKEAFQWSMDPKDPEKDNESSKIYDNVQNYFNKVISKSKRCSLNDEEKRWIEDLKSFYEAIKKFDREEFLRLKEIGEENYSMFCKNYGKKFIELARPLIKGYVDINDENCPLCPEAKKDATLESWERLNDPMRCYDMVMNDFQVKYRGVKVQNRLIEYH